MSYSDSSSEDEILQQYAPGSTRRGKARNSKKPGGKASSSSKAARSKAPSRKRKRVSYAENSSDSDVMEVENDDIEDSDFSMSDKEPKSKSKSKSNVVDLASSESDEDESPVEVKKSSKGKGKKKAAVVKTKGKGLGKKDSKSKSPKILPAALLKRRVLEADIKASKEQTIAVRKLTTRGILASEKTQVDKSDGNVLPPVLLRCNMRELIVKKQARKRERKVLMVLPGQLSVLSHGLSGRLLHLETPSPSLVFDFMQQDGAAKRLVFEGSVLKPKNDYLVIQCQQNGKQVVCNDVYTSIIAFHSYRWDEEITSPESSEDVERVVSEEVKDDIDDIDWSNPPVLGCLKYKPTDVASSDEAEEVEASNESSQEKLEAIVTTQEESQKTRKTPARSARKATKVQYIESSGESEIESVSNGDGSDVSFQL